MSARRSLAQRSCRTLNLPPLNRLFDADNQAHFWMDMAAHFERAGRGKSDRHILARLLLVRIECHRSRLDVDLMQKVVLVAEGQGVAASDADLGGMKRAPLLHD